MQFIGDGFRQIKENIWIEIALRENNVILSDSRYINEAKAIKEKNGMCVVMYRPGFENDDPNPSEAQIKLVVNFCKNYLQEGPIPNFDQLKQKFGNKCPDAMQYYDFYICNDAALEQLYDKIDRILLPFVVKKFPTNNAQGYLF